MTRKKPSAPETHTANELKKRFGIPILFVEGLPGSGKSEILKIVRSAAGDNNGIIVVNTSGAIDWHRTRTETALGKLFSSDDCIKAQKNGELLPSKPVLDGLLKHIVHIAGESSGAYALVAGGMRTKKQVKRLFQKIRHPKQAKMFEIECDEDDALSGMTMRPKHGRLENDHPDSHETKLKIAATASKDAIGYFKRRRKSGYMSVHRSQPMLQKVEALICFMGLDSDLERLLLHNCNNPHHPAGMRIQELDNPSQHKAAVQPQPRTPLFPVAAAAMAHASSFPLAASAGAA